MLCVIAKLDNAATEKLEALRKRALAESEQIKPLYGHITVATYTGDNEALFIQSCKGLLLDISAFDIMYKKVEVLKETSIIVATPEKSDKLRSIHQRIAQRYDDLDVWTKGDSWYPHTTLYYGPQADLDSICQNLAGCFSPFTAKICKIEFSRVVTNGYEIIDSIDLALR